jgi:hypothetical protein
MAFASYLGDFDVDAETSRVLDVALEMTRADKSPKTIWSEKDWKDWPDRTNPIFIGISCWPISNMGDVSV